MLCAALQPSKATQTSGMDCRSVAFAYGGQFRLLLKATLDSRLPLSGIEKSRAVSSSAATLMRGQVAFLVQVLLSACSHNDCVVTWTSHRKEWLFVKHDSALCTKCGHFKGC